MISADFASVRFPPTAPDCPGSAFVRPRQAFILSLELLGEIRKNRGLVFRDASQNDVNNGERNHPREFEARFREPSELEQGFAASDMRGENR